MPVNDATALRLAFQDAAADRKLDGKETASIIARARRDGLTESEAKELTRGLARYRDAFTPEAKKTLDDFVTKKMKKLEILDAVGPDPRPLHDPAVVPADRKRLEEELVPGGELFRHGPSGDDVEQNYLGDCYLMAAMSAVARANPRAIEDAFKKNPDGTYSVRLFERHGGQLVPKEITIDADLPRNGWYGYYYARARDPRELWPALLEKAFAARAGSYGKIEGGLPGEAMEAITGKRATDLDLRASGTSADATFAKLAAATKAGKPVTAVTLGDGSAKKYAGTNIYTDHTYTVWGTSVANGVKYVHLRNPWGESEPAGNGKDDGIFKLPLDQFMKLYCGVSIGG